MTDARRDAVPIDGCDSTDAIGRFASRGFAALWRHQRVLATDLVEGAEVIAAMVEAGRLEIDDAGELVAVHGLAARPTRHRIEHPDGAIHTWCALDAVGIPAALGIDATAITSCPTCDTELRVRIERGVPKDLGPEMLWLPASACDHLVNDFCSHANLYCNDSHLTSTIPTTSSGRAITVAEVAEIGRQTWADATEVLSR